MSTVPDSRRRLRAPRLAGAARSPTHATKSRRLGARAVALVRACPLALFLLVLVAFVHAAAYAVATAPYSGPDEDAHVGYVQYFAETGRSPERNSGTGTLSTEQRSIAYELNLNPIAGHREGRPAWDAAGAVERRLAKEGGAIRRDGSGPNAAGGYPPLYYVYGAAAYHLAPDRSPLGRVFTVRMATALMAPLTVVFVWLLAAELFTAAWPRALAAGVVALHPKVAATAGVVNPDMLLVVLGTAFLYAGTRLIRHGPTGPRLLAFGGLTVASVLTHGRGLFVVPLAGLVLLYLLWQRRWRDRRLLLQAAALVGSVAVAGVFTVLWTRGHTGGQTYGGQLPSASGFNVREFLSYVWQFYFPRFEWMEPKVGVDYGFHQVFVTTFYGALASLEIEFPASVYSNLQYGALFGIVAVYTALIVRRREIRERWPVMAFLALFLFALLAMLHLVSYVNLRGGAGDPVITGRYLLSAIALYGLAMAFVAQSLPRRLGLPLAGFLLSVHILLAGAGLGLTVSRFYG